MYQQWYDSETVTRTLEKLKQDNFVNDELFAESYINSEVIRKGRPLLVITQKLEMRGIDKSIISKVVHDAWDDIDNWVLQWIEKEIKHSTEPIIIEATFLFETELYQLCDVTIFVDAPQDKQIEHLKTRGDDVEKALKLNANFNYENKEKATVIIINDNDVASLDKQISSIFDK